MGLVFFLLSHSPAPDATLTRETAASLRRLDARKRVADLRRREKE